MLVPVKLLYALRPKVALAPLALIASSTSVFVATPFLIPAVAEDRNVSVAAAGLISATQLAGFVLGSWGGGRFLRPVRKVFVVGTLIGVCGSLLAALAPTFALLLVARVMIGIALGLGAWFAWQAAFGDDGKTNDVAVVGPLVAVAFTPVVAAFINLVGVDWYFVSSAVLLALPLLFASRVPTVDRLRPHRTRHAPTRAATVILVGLGLLTLGGSAVFIYAAAIGKEVNGISATAITLAFTGNAIAGIPAARWSRRRGPAGMWLAATGVMAVCVASIHHPAVFLTALVLWGFVFFMGVPAAFSLLAERSRFPQERAGDAQAVMALGRVFGPLFGGALYATGSTVVLGIAAGGVMLTGGVLLFAVDRPDLVVPRFAQFGAN